MLLLMMMMIFWDINASSNSGGILKLRYVYSGGSGRGWG